MLSKISNLNLGKDQISIKTNYDLISEKEVLEELDDSFLGKGTFGMVVKARYNFADVAVKTIKIESNLGEDITVEKAIATVENEIGLMKVLNHPNLANYYGYKITDDEELKLVMELCDGGNVKSLLSKGIKLTINQRLKIILDSAAGLFHLHSKNVIHRDIKSLNILLVNPVEDETSKIVCKLTDYGLSKVIDSTKSQATKSSVGTDYWMAPEVIKASEKNYYSFKADVFSFGIFMWEVFTGKTPYSDMKLNSALIACKVAMNGLRPRSDWLFQDTPQVVRDLIDQCLKDDPHLRPDMKEMYLKIDTLIQTIV
jgi:serine/threonine protein kinase